MKDVYPLMLTELPYLGEILSLGCAIVWAIAVVLFRKSGETMPPLGLNLFKDLLGLSLFIPTSLLFGEALTLRVPLSDYLLVLASGAIGIGLADTIFFRSLNILGAGLSAIVDSLYSPFTITLSIIFLQERMGPLQLLGALLIVSAVLMVSEERKRDYVSRANLLMGIGLGVLSMALMAVGIVMIKPLLNRSPLLWVIEWRLVGGCLVLGIILLFHPNRQKILHSLFPMPGWRFVLPGSFLGAYVSLVVWMGGMKYTQASVASALNQTSNVFIFILGLLFLKERVNPLKVAAIFLAFLGVGAVSLG